MDHAPIPETMRGRLQKRRDLGIACQVSRSEGTWRVDEPLGPGMDGYQILLRESRVGTARLQAALAGNQEMILFY